MKNNWWQQLVALVTVDSRPKEKLPELPALIEQAKQEWLFAQQYYNEVTDEDLIDYSLYLAKSAERRYMYLIKQARRERVVYPWTEIQM